MHSGDGGCLRGPGAAAGSWVRSCTMNPRTFLAITSIPSPMRRCQGPPPNAVVCPVWPLNARQEIHSQRYLLAHVPHPQQYPCRPIACSSRRDGCGAPSKWGRSYPGLSSRRKNWDRVNLKSFVFGRGDLTISSLFFWPCSSLFSGGTMK